MRKVLIVYILIALLTLSVPQTTNIVSAGFSSPPSTIISIISPNNQTIYNSTVPLIVISQDIFQIGEDKWGIDNIYYSLDNQSNLYCWNKTLTNLSSGQHSIVVHAEVEYLIGGFLSSGIRNNYTSNKLYFTVQPLPTTIPTSAETSNSETNLIKGIDSLHSTAIIAIAGVIVIVVIALVSLVYLKRRKRKP